eukprot:369671_1
MTDIIVNECFIIKSEKSRLIKCNPNENGYIIYEYNDNYCSDKYLHSYKEISHKICQQSSFHIQQVIQCISSITPTPTLITSKQINCDDIITGEYNNIAIDFKFILTKPSQIIFNSCSSNFNTLIQLYDSSKQGLIGISDSNNDCSLPLAQSQLVTNLLPGTYYYRLLSSSVSSIVNGIYNIEIFCIDTPRRLINECSEWMWIDNTKCQTDKYSKINTYWPTIYPTITPTQIPSQLPTNNPLISPTDTPTYSPTFAPINRPTRSPTDRPTSAPVTPSLIKVPTTFRPTLSPTNTPTIAPTGSPIITPSPNVILTQELPNVNDDDFISLAAQDAYDPEDNDNYDTSSSSTMRRRLLSQFDDNNNGLCTNYWKNETNLNNNNNCAILSIKYKQFIAV